MRLLKNKELLSTFIDQLKIPSEITIALPEKDKRIDDATKKSHNEWHSDLLGKTTGSSPHTVTDHDIDSNWYGLGWAKTYRQARKQDKRGLTVEDFEKARQKKKKNKTLSSNF